MLIGQASSCGNCIFSEIAPTLPSNCTEVMTMASLLFLVVQPYFFGAYCFVEVQSFL